MSDLWNCSPRLARITEAGCAAVHAKALETVMRKPGKWCSSPVRQSEKACAACSGVRWRFEQGLEKPPSEMPEGVMRAISLRPPARRVREKRVRKERPPRECASPGCSNMAAGLADYCTRECRSKAKDARRRGRTLVDRPARPCGRCRQPMVGKIASAKYCSLRCKSAANYEERPKPGAVYLSCPSCGVSFRRRNQRQQFCSTECSVRPLDKEQRRNLERRATPLKIACHQCGLPANNQRGRSRFCSHRCRSLWWSQNRRSNR